MKRAGLLRATVAALGGLAAVTALFAFWVMASVRTGIVVGGANAPLWAVPVVAGVAVGILSWFLLTGGPTAQEPEDDRATTIACTNCGNSVMEDWRLCPHCGSSRTSVGPSDRSAPTA